MQRLLKRLALILLTLPGSLSGQISVEGRILDASDQQPVPFCGVGIKRTQRGCLSNEDGVFRITVRSQDTLVISNVTYRSHEIAVSELVKNNLILLTARENMLSEVVVYDNDDRLYTLFEQCRKKLADSPRQQSKAYFVLESEISGQPVELLECYYNATFNGSGIESLDFKNGRLGLAAYNGRYFVNRNTSRAVSFLNLTSSDEHMPVVPFQLNKRKLKRNYLLKLKQISSGLNPLYDITFEPYVKNGDYFRGEAWIEANTGLLRKISINVRNTATHPFQPFDKEHARIESISMQITKSFQEQGDDIRPDHLDFNYQILYHHLHNKALQHANRDTTFEVSCKGVVYFYDYNKLFLLPYFKYDRDAEDYRKITSLTFNQWFWNSNNSLAYSDKRKKEISYFKNKGVMLNYRNNLEQGKSARKGFYETSYILWSGEKRLSLKKDGIRNDTLTGLRSDGRVAPQRFHLKAQVFLDLNPQDDSLQHYSATVFDVYESYYNMEAEPATNCFINIYFDLVEIERRNMEDLLSKNNYSLPQIDSLYKATTRRIDALDKDYFESVNRGKNLYALREWNNRVKDKLGIDNFELLDPEGRKH